MVTPEIIRLYPRVDTIRKTTRRGKLAGKSRIFTDTPEKNRLIETEQLKEMKKQKQERKAKAKKVKRTLDFQTKEIDSEDE